MDVSAVALTRVSALDAPIGRNHSVGPVVRRRRRRTVREALGLYLLGSGHSWGLGADIGSGGFWHDTAYPAGWPDTEQLWAFYQLAI